MICASPSYTLIYGANINIVSHPASLCRQCVLKASYEFNVILGTVDGIQIWMLLLDMSPAGGPGGVSGQHEDAGCLDGVCAVT